jgi:hypothetical protein
VDRLRFQVVQILKAVGYNTQVYVIPLIVCQILIPLIWFFVISRT